MRYIGNKNKALSQIEEILRSKNLLREGLVFCDAFSGTATVGDYFQQYFTILANDSLGAAYYTTK